MAISSNKYKLRSSLVRYEKFNELLPKRNNTSSRFSDIDMFHTHNGHRLFIELKHQNAKRRDDQGVSKSIDEMFRLSMSRGEYCLVLWGVYKDFNVNTSNYYSEFVPSSARIYHPLKNQIVEYETANLNWLRSFFYYWYQICERQTPNELYERANNRASEELPRFRVFKSHLDRYGT